MIIDTHTHIFLNKKNEEKNIILNLKKDNIDKIISIGIDLETSKKSIDLAQNNHGIIFATIGIHPNYVGKYKNDLIGAINSLEYMILNNIKHIKGIGECGLDYYRINKDNFEEEKYLQEQFFISQIYLAQKYSLPIIIHTRDSKEDTLEIIKKTNIKKFVLHCYSEDLDFAYKAIYYSDECKISFSGIVTYPGALQVQSTACNIPLDRILVETDCPFLSPQEVRGKENIPNHVKYNLEKIFKLRQKNGKKETFEEFENQVYKNSKNFFGL